MDMAKVDKVVDKVMDTVKEKVLDKEHILHENKDMGMVKIADDVVAIIAGIAATEVEGVSAMAGNITNELMGKVGMKLLNKGVKVEVLGTAVTVDLAVMMDYGYNIPEISQVVQRKVKSAIENMTGLEVVDVHIRIAGISMQKNK